MTETVPVSKPAAAANSASGIKDTIDSILVAFILAFIFRAFIVEAFVIPTGSMAPTLLGAHWRLSCPDCGYTFDVNFPTESGSSDPNIPVRAFIPQGRNEHASSVTCPNCGYDVPTRSIGDPVGYGDRILVLKYLYLAQPPTRWDVVVFKSPDPPPGVTPEHYNYSTNYIKRLVGLPGETLMVLDGDVYAAPPTAPGNFQILRKSDGAQDALWRIVYDDDYFPIGKARLVDPGLRPDFQQPWKPRAASNGWTTGRTLDFNQLNGAGTLYFDPDVAKQKHALTDWLAYDQLSPWSEFKVSDLLLKLTAERTSGTGVLSLKLTKYQDQFRAELGPGEAKILRVTSTGETTTVGAAAIDLSSHPHAIEFSNVDYRVTLKIDGQIVIRADYAPDLTALTRDYNSLISAPPATVEITAANQATKLSHVSLWRDIYYTNHMSPSSPRWGIPNNPVTLGADEYFVLGDNSQVSGDARFWPFPVQLPDEDLNVQAGRVPGRFMLGKAFFVYWPAGYRPVSTWDWIPALIPNFGDMRFIH